MGERPRCDWLLIEWRGDLSQILYDATRAEVEYVFGDSVTGLNETTDHVEVTFEHATPRTFDLVIGAAGLRSAVRIAFGDESQFVRDLGCGVSIGTVPIVYAVVAAVHRYLGCTRRSVLVAGSSVKAPGQASWVMFGQTVSWPKRSIPVAASCSGGR